ncbi:NAD(P)/FAD-dependent oxidoreductase [Staphylococcus cohnii]
MDDNVVIVGGSIAGIFAAKELRKKGYQGGIKIVESEERLPYDKPPLTKEWMQDNENTAIPLLEKENFYDDNNIEIVLNTKIINIDTDKKQLLTERNKIINIDTDKKQLLTERNKIINYDKLVLATGVKNKKLNYSNQNLNIHYLSNFLDALSIKEEASKEKQDIVILGGGFIGLELAASLKNLNHNVTLISRSEYPLSKIIGNQAAKYIKQLHEKNGINFMTNDTIKEIEGKDTVKKITTANNLEIQCNILIAGIGTFFEEIRNQGVEKLNTNNQGYIVNEYGQTNIKDVYAIGDCAV